MRVIITMKGGSASLQGDLPCKDEDELVEYLNRTKANEVFILDKVDNTGGQAIISKSNIGFITRKR